MLGFLLAAGRFGPRRAHGPATHQAWCGPGAASGPAGTAHPASASAARRWGLAGGRRQLVGMGFPAPILGAFCTKSYRGPRQDHFERRPRTGLTGESRRRAVEKIEVRRRRDGGVVLFFDKRLVGKLQGGLGSPRVEEQVDEGLRRWPATSELEEEDDPARRR